MLSIYRFQINNLKKYTRLQQLGSSIIGGSEKNGTKTVKSIYFGITSPDQVLDALRNKGEQFLGFISVQESKELCGELLAELQSNPALSAIIVCGQAVYAYRWIDSELASEVVNIEDVDFLALKQNGMLRQVDDGYYSIRLKVVAGNLASQDLVDIAAVAKKYAGGKIHITSRQGIEIPFVHIADLPEFFSALQEKGLQLGASGPRVRAVIGCQGNFVCPNGLIETTAFSQKIVERFFGRDLPHKFKIAVTGCPNNCIKADINDFGIKGAAKVISIEENCKHCGACAKVCPVDAITVTSDSMVIDENTCIGCGKCVRACSFNAIKAQHGYRVTVGGTFGRNMVIGRPLYPFVESAEQVLNIIEATLQFFKEYGLPKERINKTIARIGWKEFEKFVAEHR